MTEANISNEYAFILNACSDGPKTFDEICQIVERSKNIRGLVRRIWKKNMLSTPDEITYTLTPFGLQVLQTWRTWIKDQT